MHNFCTLLTNYLNDCRYQKKLSDKTLKAYAIDLKQFSVFSSGCSEPLKKHNLTKYIEFLNKRYKPKSVKRKIAVLKAFCSYLVYEDLLEVHPFSKIRTNFREPALLPRVIPLRIIQALLKAAYALKEQPNLTQYQYRCSLRDIAILELLFAVGLRVSELTCLKPADLDLMGRTVKIYGKGARERVLYLENRDVINALQAYHKVFFQEIQSCGFFFVNSRQARYSEQSVRNMIAKYVEMIGCPLHITPHMFRHSFATFLLEEDVDLRYIQDFLGHSSVTTTQIYTHVSSSKQRKILAAKHPRNRILQG